MALKAFFNLLIALLLFSCSFQQQDKIDYEAGFYSIVTEFEESSILNFRALNIRESHERPEAIEETSVVVTGLKIERILQGIKMLENQTTGKRRNINLVSDYNISNVSLKIERIILSHIDFVNRVVWQKE